MRRPLVALALLVCLPVLAAPDPCDNAFRVTARETTACDGNATCGADRRVLTLCELRRTLVAQYAPLHQKAKRLSVKGKPAFSLTNHLDACIAAEQKIAGATSALDFGDRTRRCLAGLQDTHFHYNTPIPTPPVFTGFDLREVDGKFYVTGRITKLAQFLRDVHHMPDVMDELKPGTRILSIDGKDPKAARDALKPYIAASSEAYANQQATDAIFDRNFLYPTKPTVAVEVEKGKESRTLNLPWWTKRTANRAAAAYLAKLEIKTTDVIQFSQNTTGHWEYSSSLDLEGYYPSKTILAPEDSKDLDLHYAVSSDGKKGAIAMRSGRVTMKGGKTFCYLQLTTFDTTYLAPADSNVASKWIEPVATFIKYCEDKELPLLIDMRGNGGGQTRHPGALLSALLKKDDTYPGVAYAFRANAHTQTLLEAMSGDADAKGGYADGEGRDLFLDTSPTLLEQLRKALDDKKAHSDIVISKQLRAHEKVNGFHQKVVALISPSCISSCDLAAALLKRSGRATLIGTATNGTGAGFAESVVAPKFCDANGCMQIRVPNILFGVPLKATRENVLPFDKFEDDVLTENRPTAPDISYTPTVADLSGSAHGWLDTAVKELFH